MRIFILEDDPRRISWMKKNFYSGIKLDITDVAKEAITLLTENRYDIVFLDHDLGGEQMVDSSVLNTGSTVAKMIHETKNKDLTVIIHSYNPSGAEIMINSMRNNGVECHYFPFQSEEFLSVVNQINKSFKNKEDSRNNGIAT